MARFSVRVQPNTRSDAVIGWVLDDRGGETLRLRLRAPAVDGQANEALIDYLAERLDVRRSQVAIDRGEKSRKKLVVVQGLELDQIKRRFGA